jgi:hypothetical protein
VSLTATRSVGGGPFGRILPEGPSGDHGTGQAFDTTPPQNHPGHDCAGASSRHGPTQASDDAAESDSGRMARLRRENEQLRQAMASRPLIDMARGVLMSRLGCSTEESFEILVEVSQHTNVRVRCVSEAIVAAVTGKEPLPRGLRDHLVTAMSRRQVKEHEAWEAG